MELTRRDAVAALAALGTASGAVSLANYHEESGTKPPSERSGDQSSEEGPDDETVQTVMVDVAEVVYPSDVDGVAEFVSAFLAGRLDDPDRREGIRGAVATLDDRSRSWYDQPVTELEAAKRDQLLREVGVDTADEAPDGSSAERIRYYVVNELLLALYSSPTGGELVGIENPQGHPGGTDSYQQGPR